MPDRRPPSVKGLGRAGSRKSLPLLRPGLTGVSLKVGGDGFVRLRGATPDVLGPPLGPSEPSEEGATSTAMLLSAGRI
eukprot:5179476-Alexandrium_andersonii.AAC.1